MTQPPRFCGCCGQPWDECPHRDGPTEDFSECRHRWQQAGPQPKLAKEWVYRHVRLVLDYELMVFIAQGRLDKLARLIADDLVGNWDTVLMAYEAGLVDSNGKPLEEK